MTEEQLQYKIDGADSIVYLNDENRIEQLKEHFGETGVNMMIELYGEPTRVGGIAVGTLKDGKVNMMMLGDCPCGGAKCRGAWGWMQKGRDLDMAGHRGSLKSVVCSSFVPRLFDPVLGEMICEAPYGMNQEHFYRFQRAHWGDASKQGLRDFLASNLAIAEGKTKSSWTPDEEASQ